MHVTAVSQSPQRRSTPFHPSSDQIQVGHEWEEWLEGIDEAQDKKDAMLIYGGKELGSLNGSLTDPENGDDYKKPWKTQWLLYTKEEQTPCKIQFFENWSRVYQCLRCQIRRKAPACKFNDANERILEHIMQTIDNTSLIQKTIDKAWDLDQNAEVTLMEDTKLRLKDMRDGQEQKVNNLVTRLAQQSAERRIHRTWAPEQEEQTCWGKP